MNTVGVGTCYGRDKNKNVKHLFRSFHDEKVEMTSTGMYAVKNGSIPMSQHPLWTIDAGTPTQLVKG